MSLIYANVCKFQIIYSWLKYGWCRAPISIRNLISSPFNQNENWFAPNTIYNLFIKLKQIDLDLIAYCSNFSMHDNPLRVILIPIIRLYAIWME